MCPASTNTGFNSDANLYRCELYKQRVVRLPIKILRAMIIEKKFACIAIKKNTGNNVMKKKSVNISIKIYTK